MALRNHINRSTLTIGAVLVASMGYFSHAALSRVWPRPLHPVEEIGTAFTYQGQLADEGSPVTGTADLTFSLWDAVVEGNQIGPTQDFFDVSVDRGLFSVELDFGDDAFEEGARWTQIQARTPAGGGDYELLDPRQRVNPVPYAMNRSEEGVHATTLKFSHGSPGGSNVWVLEIPADGYLTITGGGTMYSNGSTAVGVRLNGDDVAIGEAWSGDSGGDWNLHATVAISAGTHSFEVWSAIGPSFVNGGFTLVFHANELIATEQQ